MHKRRDIRTGQGATPHGSHLAHRTNIDANSSVTSRSGGAYCKQKWKLRALATTWKMPTGCWCDAIVLQDDVSECARHVESEFRLACLGERHVTRIHTQLLVAHYARTRHQQGEHGWKNKQCNNGGKKRVQGVLTIEQHPNPWIQVFHPRVEFVCVPPRCHRDCDTRIETAHANYVTQHI